jgi:membrane protein insertase Oxa1/YidC/SpoIIIJ
MPIWFGLNRALSYAIELRHTKWLWVTDLASKDPYYVLPVLVGVTMYLVSKMTPMTTTDPQQAQMMNSSLVGIVQQWYLNRSHPLPAPAKPTRAKN